MNLDEVAVCGLLTCFCSANELHLLRSNYEFFFILVCRQQLCTPRLIPIVGTVDFVQRDSGRPYYPRIRQDKPVDDGSKFPVHPAIPRVSRHDSEKAGAAKIFGIKRL